MKYYSEKLNKNFDTVEELEKAENQLSETDNLVALINEKIDEKLEEYKEAEHKASGLLKEISALMDELIDAKPSEFLRVFDVVKKLRDISNECYDEANFIPKVDTKDPVEVKEKEDESEIDLESILSNLLKNISE